MSGVIKAGSADRMVRPIGAVQARVGTEPRVGPPPKSAIELALEDARDEISRLQTALIDARGIAEESETAAREAGRQEALLVARDEDDRRLASILDGVAAARSAWDDRLAKLDALAAMLARSALAKIFGDDAARAELVARAIALRVEALRGETVVSIRVSALDFPNTDALAALRADAGVGAIEVKADGVLAAGESRIDLQLGHVDVGISSQWHELDRFFESILDIGTSA